VKEWRGTIDAELLPKERASVFRPARFELATSAFAALYHEVTDIFTTALPGALLRRAFGCWGTGDLGFQQSIRRCFLAKASQPATHQPPRGQFHGTIDHRRDSNPLYQARSIRNLHHHRSRRCDIRNEKLPGEQANFDGLAAFGDNEVTKFITTWNEELQMQQAKLTNFVAALS
jgi:hypothetical protein